MPATTETPVEEGARILGESVRGSRQLLLRGIAFRGISIPTALLLAWLVTPAQYGLLSVVRGLLALASFAGELGFESATLRRTVDTTDEELGAIAGFRVLVLSGVALLVLVLPPGVTGLAAIPPEWRGWMLALLASLVLTAFQVGCRVRLERSLNYAALSRYEVTSLAVQSVGLVAFALRGRFELGIFVVLILMSVFNTLYLLRLAPTLHLSFDLAVLRPLARQTAGFSVSLLLYQVRESGTPVLLTRLFGLDIAGAWAFASRIGQVLQTTFEGQSRAGLPAAARLSSQPVLLRHLMTVSLRDAARLAFPIAAGLFGMLPLLATYWPKWSGAIIMSQWYVLSLAFFGVFWAALSPTMNVLRGSTGATIYLGLSLGALWTGLVVLAGLETPNVALAYVASGVASLPWLIASVPVALRPDWRTAVGGPAAGAVVILAVYAGCNQLGVGSMITAVLTAGLSAAVVAMGLHRR